MKVAVLGAGGQLGTAVRRCAPSSIELRTFTRPALNVVDRGQIAAKLEEWRPDLIVNTAAYTRVDDAESDPDAAFAINAEAVRCVAEFARGVDARLLHISTDFVFSGDRAVPYPEHAPTGPINVYGQSKLEGERAALKILGSRATVLRTAWLYSREGSNFVNKMLHAMTTQNRIRVVYDQVGTPTWVQSVAKAIWQLAARPQISGIHHITDDGVASWYDLAMAVLEEASCRGLVSHDVRVCPIRTRDYPTPAKRPAYSVLDKEATLATLGIETNHWRVNLRAMLDEHVAS